jgi:hypothetical protein
MLGGVHGSVRGPEQQVEVGAILWVGRDADGRGQLLQWAVPGQRDLAHRGPQRLGDGYGFDGASHGPRYGPPNIVAALIKPDLWITLKRE